MFSHTSGRPGAIDVASVNRGLIVGGWVALGFFCVTGGLTLAGFGPHLWSGFTSWLQDLQSPWLTTAMKVITTGGAWYVFLVVCLVLVIVPATRLRYGVPIAAVTVIAGGLNAALKAIFREPRPDGHRLIVESGFSFPSGHAMISGAFVAMAVFLVLVYWASRRARITVSVLLIVAGGLIGTSRVYLGVHWPLDILGGFLAAFAVFVLTAWLWWRLWPMVNRSRHQSGSR